MFKRCLAVIAATLMLTGCLLTPGKFASELKLMRDGSFAFTYKGEIQILALSKLAEMAAQEEFEAEDCKTEDMEARPCTDAEIASQRAEWEARANTREAKNAEEQEMMKTFLGGIDPSNPEAAQELARKLERQRGWDKVAYKGNGLFDVEFAIEGTRTHDFTFPTIEKMPMANNFVSVVLRDARQVRVDAPAFSAGGSTTPMQGAMMGLMQMGANESSEETPPTKMVAPEGTFTIVTDGNILANNTDEGPVQSARGKVLTWEITQRTQHAPTALIAF